MKRYPFVFLFLLWGAITLACAAGAATPTPTPTAPPNPLDIGGTMVAAQIASGATQQSIDIQLSATAYVLQGTPTAAAAMTQQAIFEQQRQDAMATDQRARQDAEATAQQERDDAQATQQAINAVATQQAINAMATQQRLDFEATQEQARRDLDATQRAEATAQAWTVTQAVLPTHDLWTQQAVQQEMLLATNEVELSNLKVKQQRDTNVLQWLVPMLLASLLAFGAVVWAIRYSRIREIKNGDGTPLLILQDNKFGIVPQLMPAPVISITKSGVTMEPLVDPAEQSEVTKRAQAIEALANMPEKPTDNAADAFNRFFGAPVDEEELPFDILDAEDPPPPGLLDEHSLEALQKDWKEAKGE